MMPATSLMSFSSLDLFLLKDSAVLCHTKHIIQTQKKDNLSIILPRGA
jgi:hypothetical protein